MWLRLDDEDAAFLVELLDREMKESLHLDEIGREKLKPILVRMNEPDHPHAAAFRNAVPADDDLEVDADAWISESDMGAFVMCWHYVTNEDAGIPATEDDDD